MKILTCPSNDNSNNFSSNAETEPVRFGEAIRIAEEKLRLLDHRLRAIAVGARFSNNRYSLSYFGKQAEIIMPQCDCLIDGKQSGSTDKVLILHYLLDCIDIAPSGNWVSFREVKNSNSYLGAFINRCPGVIAARFDGCEEEFRAAATGLGGVAKSDLPGIAFVIHAFPRLPLGVILHPGEPGLPTQAQVLFDHSSTVYWPAEDLAVTGETAARLLAE